MYFSKETQIICVVRCGRSSPQPGAEIHN